jgi:predicted nuclease of predicted toxin-antitoxin system
VKLLLDSCIWGLAKTQLQELGHDAVWAGDWDVDQGDNEILHRVTSEHRFLVTLDKVLVNSLS